MASAVTMRALLEAGVHFGHQTRRWNPKMKPYIFQERNGIYIIDLGKTLAMLNAVYEEVKQMSREGRVILFVGTKKQAQDVVNEEAERAGTFFVNQRWLGGTLTNFATIQKRIARLRELEGMRQQGTFDLLPKKEVSRLTEELEKLEKFLGGIKDMHRLPDAMFIVDPKKERIAVPEAQEAAHPDHRRDRHELRSRRDRLPDPGQRRRDPRGAPDGREDRRRDHRRQDGDGIVVRRGRLRRAIRRTRRGGTRGGRRLSGYDVNTAYKPTADDVKRLREDTGAGMIDGRNALV